MSSRPWAGSTRRHRLPANWSTPGGLRDQVLKAPGGRVCKLRYEDCTRSATEANHKIPGDDQSMDTLQSACSHCHRIKSSREGAAAKPRERRAPETHPAYKRMERLELGGDSGGQLHHRERRDRRA